MRFPCRDSRHPTPRADARYGCLFFSPLHPVPLGALVTWCPVWLPFFSPLHPVPLGAFVT